MTKSVHESAGPPNRMATITLLLAASLSAGAGIKTELSTLSGRVLYEGRVEGPIRVEVYDRPQFSPRPVYLTVIPHPGLYEVQIRPGTYYLRAFVDKNENQRWDRGEPVGIYQKENALIILPLASKGGIDIQIDIEEETDHSQRENQ